MVPECYLEVEVFEDDCKVDVVSLFPYGVVDPLEALSGGEAALGVGEPNVFSGERGGGEVPC